MKLQLVVSVLLIGLCFSTVIEKRDAEDKQGAEQKAAPVSGFIDLDSIEIPDTTAAVERIRQAVVKLSPDRLEVYKKYATDNLKHRSERGSIKWYGRMRIADPDIYLIWKIYFESISELLGKNAQIKKFIQYYYTNVETVDPNVKEDIDRFIITAVNKMSDIEGQARVDLFKVVFQIECVFNDLNNKMLNLLDSNHKVVPCPV